MSQSSSDKVGERKTAPVMGPIPRIERQRTHYNFLWAVRPPAAMTNLIHAQRMLMHGETADTFFPPETSVLLTSTIPDDDLMEYTFGDELRTVVEFDPDYYLPFDFPVYGDMPEERRMEHIRQVGGGTLDMARILNGDLDSDGTQLADELNIDPELVKSASETTTDLVPLIKGSTPAERNVMEQVAVEIDASMIAKYGTQYMLVSKSGNYPELRRVLEAINDETNGFPLVVIGLLSPTGKYSLEGVPDNVIGGAGLNQWRKRVAPAENTPKAMRAGYTTLDEAVSTALDIPQQYDKDEAANSGDEPPNDFESAPRMAVNVEDGEFGIGIAGAVETPEEYGFGGRKREETESSLEVDTEASDTDTSEAGG